MTCSDYVQFLISRAPITITHMTRLVLSDRLPHHFVDPDYCGGDAMIRRIGCASALILGLIGAAQADAIRNFNVGNWYAGAYTNDQTKAFSHCAASGHYNSGIFVIFSIDRSLNFKWGLPIPLGISLLEPLTT